MELIQQARQCVIILHEIYGLNAHITHYAHALYEQGFDVYVPNLLARPTPFSYEEQQLAYAHFITTIGFDKAHKDVKDFISTLANDYSHIRLIGFSIGATIAWLCSDHPAVEKVICFYGSRIRQYLDVIPLADTTLLFGRYEKSFDPATLQASLAAYPNVAMQIVEAAHGFADPYSPTYNQSITETLFAYLVD